jgi:uncharacterized protein (TIGR03437 family)
MYRILCISLLAATASFAQTGTTVPELASLDRATLQLLGKYKIPGIALSIAKDGKLIYARGFGVADLVSGEPTQPDSLFRIASVSKPLTAVGVLKLVEEGKLALDTKVIPYLGLTARADSRYNDITVRHLLQHSAGFDITKWGFDPTFPDRQTLLALGVSLPHSRNDVIQFALNNLTLAFAPGTREAYSNLGYMFLTNLIERATGQSYEAYMKEKVFHPLNLQRLHIAGSLLSDRRPGEVRYLDSENFDASIFPNTPPQVLSTYGTFNIGTFASGGGWLAAMPDLVRFLSAFDAGSGLSLLKPETVRLMTERPAYTPANATAWYALGWTITRTAQGERWDHDGALPGTSAWFFRSPNGLSVAIAANTLPTDDQIGDFFSDMQLLFETHLLNVNRFPLMDLSATYFPTNTPRLADAGVVNAASLRPGPVANQSIVKLFGLNLAGAQIRINNTTVDALWAANGELHAAVPANASGPTRVEVFNNGRVSNAITIDVQASAEPALFTISGNGYGPLAALNQDLTLNSPSNPAAPGSIIVVYGTGLNRPTPTVDRQPATILFSGQAPGMIAGVQQMNLRLPSSLPKGQAAVVLTPYQQEAVIFIR